MNATASSVSRHKWWISCEIQVGGRFEPTVIEEIFLIQIERPATCLRESCHFMDAHDYSFTCQSPII